MTLEKNKIIFLVILAVLFLSFVQVMLNISLNKKSGELIALEENHKKLNKQNKILGVKVAEKTSLARIEKIAKNELNMTEPQQKAMLVYNNKNQEHIPYYEEVNIDTDNLFTEIYQKFQKRSIVKAKE